MTHMTLPPPSPKWTSLAEELLAEIIATYARYGAICAPTLRIVLTGSPIPTYNRQTEQIEFYLPDPATPLGRLSWLYYQHISGATDLDDTQSAIQNYLPLIIAHEVAHHLRFRYQRLAESQWHEEEIVQLMALALVAEHPRFAALLEPIEHLSRRAANRLSQIVQKRHQSHTDSTNTLSHQQLIALMSTPTPDEQTPTQIDVTDYWLAGMLWMLPHLEKRDWPPLAQLVNEHLISYGTSKP